MKILEKLARDIKNGYFKQLKTDGIVRFDDIAQTAIDSLGIVILEKDAEVEVGDILQDIRNKECFSYGKEGKRYNMRGVFGSDCSHCKILSRKGQLTIQEGE